MPADAVGRLVASAISALSSTAARFSQRRKRKTLVTKATFRDASDAKVKYVRGVVDQDFEMESDCILGKGYSGSVLAARCRRTGRRVAVKPYSKREISESRLESLRSEVNIYMGMSHRHIATLLYVYESADALSLVMELCAGKELHGRLGKKKRFSEGEAARGAREMCAAVAYLHRMGVVHRDLKLQNWLYKSEAEDAPLKLIDFGFSLQWDRERLMKECLGSLNYMAPEVLQENYSEKCDMWSLGVIVYSMLVGTNPFRAATEGQIEGKIRSCDWSFPNDESHDISESARDFVGKLLTLDVTERMSAEQCLKHTWLQNGLETLPWQIDLSSELSSLSAVNAPPDSCISSCERGSNSTSTPRLLGCDADVWKPVPPA